MLAIILMFLGGSVCRAELVPTEATVDFGRVSSLSMPQRNVVLQCRGNSPVEITEGKASCGCVRVEVVTPRIEPGQNGQVRLTLYPLRAAAGENVWEVVLRFREQGRVDELRLAVCAHVIREVTVSPPQLELAVSTKVEREVVLTDHREKPLRITRLETTSPAMKATLVESSPAEARPRRYCIRLEVSADVSETPQESLLVIHTDDPQCPQLLVPVRLRRWTSGPILVHPTEATLLISGRQPTSRLFTFRDRQGRPCRIEQVESNHSAVQCQWPEGAFPVSTLRITVRTELLPPDLQYAEVAVHFAEPEKYTLRLHLPIIRR